MERISKKRRTLLMSKLGFVPNRVLTREERIKCGLTVKNFAGRGLSRNTTQTDGTRSRLYHAEQSQDSSVTVGEARTFVRTVVARRGRYISPISRRWLTRPAVVKRGLREICNLLTPEGYAEYEWRKILMWIRQNGICCNCREPLSMMDMTFEHENGRGGGKRDDRIAELNENGLLIRHINGVSHLECNSWRGSRRMPLYHGNNCSTEAA